MAGILRLSKDVQRASELTMLRRLPTMGLFRLSAPRCRAFRVARQRGQRAGSFPRCTAISTAMGTGRRYDTMAVSSQTCRSYANYLANTAHLQCICIQARVIIVCLQGTCNHRPQTPSEPQGTPNEFETCREHGGHCTLALGDDRLQCAAAGRGETAFEHTHRSRGRVRQRRGDGRCGHQDRQTACPTCCR